MNESATKVPEVSEEKPIEPRQLREFDARLLQQMPALGKAAMQHFIEHPEEMRARLLHYGFNSMSSISTQGLHARDCENPWLNFYGEIFGVAPDFSRIHIPCSQVYTYITPIFVAPKLELKRILEAFSQFGVEIKYYSKYENGCCDLKSAEYYSENRVCDLRSTENYIALFSMRILEDTVEEKRDDMRYRSSRMTLREYLLWILFCLHLRKNAPQWNHVDYNCDLDFIPSIRELSERSFISTTVNDNMIPMVSLQKYLQPTSFHSCIHLNLASYVHKSPWYKGKVRRVKLFESLPQI